MRSINLYDSRRDNSITNVAIDRRTSAGGHSAYYRPDDTAPRSKIATGDAAPRGILRWALPFNAGSLDPMTGRTAGEFSILYTMFDPLIDFDPVTLEPRPGLAKSLGLRRLQDADARPYGR